MCIANIGVFFDVRNKLCFFFFGIVALGGVSLLYIIMCSSYCGKYSVALLNVLICYGIYGLLCYIVSAHSSRHNNMLYNVRIEKQKKVKIKFTISKSCTFAIENKQSVICF